MADDHRSKPVLLVTGASGLLGANFVFSAREAYRVVAWCGRHCCHWANVQSIQGDLTSDAETADLLAQINPDIIAHFAAATDVDRCERYPAEAEHLNVSATRRLASFAAAKGKYMLFMSTDSVFAGDRGLYTETDEPAPINVYASSKLAAERIVTRLVDDHLVVRGNLYGWNAQEKSSLAEWMLKRFESGEPVAGFTDAVFAPLLANSLSETMIQLLQSKAKGLIHLASSDVVTKYEFAQLIAAEFVPSQPQVLPSSIKSVPFVAARPPNTSLATVRLRQQFCITAPTVREDLCRFRALREQGYLDRLKNTVCERRLLPT